MGPYINRCAAGNGIGEGANSNSLSLSLPPFAGSRRQRDRGGGAGPGGGAAAQRLPLHPRPPASAPHARARTHTHSHTRAHTHRRTRTRMTRFWGTRADTRRRRHGHEGGGAVALATLPVRSRGAVTRCGHMVRSRGAVTWCGHMVRSRGAVTRCGHFVCLVAARAHGFGCWIDGPGRAAGWLARAGGELCVRVCVFVCVCGGGGCREPGRGRGGERGGAGDAGQRRAHVPRPRGCAPPPAAPRPPNDRSPRGHVPWWTCRAIAWLCSPPWAAGPEGAVTGGRRRRRVT